METSKGLHSDILEIERIIRVDHAGERGAISIYRAQLAIARLFYQDIVAELLSSGKLSLSSSLSLASIVPSPSVSIA
ncbi:MAG: hypothetical protein CMF25_07840 [Kangiellaceae bacterium]|nr:hypothetical protein [Kangiellaceae bacterium]